MSGSDMSGALPAASHLVTPGLEPVDQQDVHLPRVLDDEVNDHPRTRGSEQHSADRPRGIALVVRMPVPRVPGEFVEAFRVCLQCLSGNASTCGRVASSGTMRYSTYRSSRDRM